jgi:hypothetical protein
VATSTAAEQKPKKAAMNIKEQMLKFQQLQSKIGVGSSESTVPSPMSQAFSPNASAIIHSPPSQQTFPRTGSPTESVPSSGINSPYPQSVFSEAPSPGSLMDEPSMMESVEALLNDPANKIELIENLQVVFDDTNSLNLQQQLTTDFMS